MKIGWRTRAAFSFLVLAAIGAHAALPPRDVEVDMLDIGQGDSILIQDGLDQTLIDGGPDDAVLGQLGDAMPMLDRTIETMVLTHPHADHYMGLISVLERYKVKTVILSSLRMGSGDYLKFQRALAASGANVIEAKDGDEVTLGGRTRAEVLWPPADPAARAKALANKDDNEKSVVLRMEAEGHMALFTGDATPDVEAALLATHRDDLRAEFLKVAHHGSRYSSTSPFLAAVQPKFAAISVGAKNKYGHPGWETLQRLGAIGTLVWRTDRNGTIRATFAPDGISVRAARK